MSLLCFNYDVKNWDEIAELLSEYHHNLCLNGVNDYPLEDFLVDVKIATAVFVINVLKTAIELSPEKFKSFMKGLMGGEKGEEFVKIVTKKGGLSKHILLLTSIYVNDKDNFLVTNS